MGNRKMTSEKIITVVKGVWVFCSLLLGAME